MEKGTLDETKLGKLQDWESDLKEGFPEGGTLVKPRVAMYLKALGFDYEWSDEYNTFIIPLKVSLEEGEEGENSKEKTHAMLVQIKGMWLSMRVGLLGNGQIPKDREEEMYVKLLKANSTHPEFAFSMNDRGDLGYNQDIFIPALNFDVFMEELLSLPKAVKFFWKEVIPQLKEMETEERSFYYT